MCTVENLNELPKHVYHRAGKIWKTFSNILSSENGSSITHEAALYLIETFPSSKAQPVDFVCHSQAIFHTYEKYHKILKTWKPAHLINFCRILDSIYY